MLIPRTAFEAARVAAKEDSRYAIAGARVAREPEGGATLTATDGHVLVEVAWQDVGHPDRDPGLFPVVGLSLDPVDGFHTILPAKACKDALKLAPANGVARQRPILGNVALEETAEPAQVRLAGTDLETVSRAEVRTLEARNLDYRKVFPQEEPQAVARFNPELMAGMLTAMAKAVGAQGVPMVELRIHGEDRPAVAVMENAETGIRATGAIMPVREGGGS